jgi:hypothetical protein
MNAATFSQPNVVHVLCTAIAKLQNGDLSARILAEAVAPRFPDVPLTVLRVFAASVLRLHFEPIDTDEIDKATLSNPDAAEACEFLAAACAAEADALRASFPGPHLSIINGGP